MKVIARIHNPYDVKFGVPRQSGLVEEVVSTIVFEPEYRSAEALRGIEEFSHLWLIWAFDRAEREKWSPTVRPPRLGGNRRIGVFDPVAIPSQRHRTQLREAAGCGKGKRRYGTEGQRSGFDERYADL